MKTKEELAVLKAKVDALNNKLAELSDEELAQVIGGVSGTEECVKNVKKGMPLIEQDKKRYDVIGE